jgi:hypothetical protein
VNKALLSLLLIAAPAFGAFERGGGLTPGPVTAITAVPGSPWTAFVNPGAVPSVHHRTLALAHIPRPFGLADLAQSALTYIEPLSFGIAAITLQRYGFELYREITAGVVIGAELEDRWNVGIGVQYFSLTIPGYGSAGTVGIDAGMVLEVSDGFRAGVAALNLNAPAIGRNRERLPQVLSLGLSYQPMGGLLLAIDLVKEIRFPPDILLGVEFAPVKTLRILVGSGTDPASFRAGMTFAYGLAEVGYIFSNHPDLGATHRFSLVLALDML